ncbi:Nephrocystin-3, partial [Stylophora pistillata]
MSQTAFPLPDSYNNLGSLLNALGETDRAKDYYKPALEIRQKKVGPDRVDVATSYNNLGSLHSALGETDRAKDYYKRALAIRLIKLGPDHVDVVASYNNLGSLHSHLGETDQAKDYHKRALEIQLRNLEPDHVHVAVSYNNLVALHSALGETDQAKDYYKRALEIRLKKLGPDHLHVAASYNNLVSYNNLGRLHSALGETDRGKDYYKRVLEIRLKKLGPDHVHVAASYYNLGCVHNDLGELQEARHCLDRALDLFQRNLLTPNSDMERMKPPSELDIDSLNLADIWKEWKEAWKLYRISSGPHEKDDAIQIATIQSIHGTKARRVLKTPPNNPEGITQRTVGGILTALETYCFPRKNTTYERYVFRTITQEDRSFDIFVTDLRRRAEYCDVGAITDSLIRDQIVVGIND